MMQYTYGHRHGMHNLWRRLQCRRNGSERPIRLYLPARQAPEPCAFFIYLLQVPIRFPCLDKHYDSSGDFDLVNNGLPA